MCLSQCPSGTCSLLTYENGALLYNLGIIEGKDMTPEAAFAKLAYLMGKGYFKEELRELMERDIRGEITERPIKVTGQAYLDKGTSSHQIQEDLNLRFQEDNVRRFESVSDTQSLTAQSTAVGESSDSAPVSQTVPISPAKSPAITPPPRPFSQVSELLRRSCPDLHTETHPSIHTHTCELDHFGHSHFEVPDHKIRSVEKR